MAGLWRPLLQLGAAAAWLCALGALSAVPGPPESRAQGECGMPLQIENAEWSGSGTRLRYSCVKNYKRKAGKSSLVVCKQDSVTKEFRWEAQLSCIRDPSLPAPKSMTEGSRREAETSTSATPKAVSVNPAAVSSTYPYGSETISQPASSTTSTSTLPRTVKLWPDRPSRATPTTTTEVGRHTPGTVTERATPCKGTTTHVSEASTSKILTAGKRSAAVSSRGDTGFTPQTSISVAPAQMLTGSPYFRIGLICLVAVVLIVLLVLILVCLYRRQHRVLQQADIPLAERIPMAVERAEGDQTTPTATNPDDPGPTTEGTQMLPSPCATSTS